METKNNKDTEETANSRLREIINDLESSDYKIGEAMGMAVSSVSIFTSKLRPKKMTLEFSDRFLQALPFVNREYFTKGYDENGNLLNMYTKEPTKSDRRQFKKTYGTTSKLSSSVSKDVCDRVFHLRSRMEETQLSFAEKLECVRWSITAIEGGRQNPSLSFIKKLKETCNVNLDWLIMGNGDMFAKEYSLDNSETIEALKNDNARLNAIINKLAGV